jgi:hypothetical protein
VPFCASVTAAGGVLGTAALTAAASSLGTGILGEPAPPAGFAIQPTLRSVERTCSCARAMSTPIYVTGKLNTAISWADDGYGPYDVVRGKLGTLQATGGNFTAALNAIDYAGRCVAHESVATVVVDGYAQPLPNTGYFYLVRGGNGNPFVCATLYDEIAHQVGKRDAEITAASGSCP